MPYAVDTRSFRSSKFEQIERETQEKRGPNIGAEEEQKLSSGLFFHFFVAEIVVIKHSMHCDLRLAQ